MDKNKLYAAIQARGLSVKEVSESLGLSRSGFWKKVNGIHPFTLREGEQLSYILDIEDPAQFFFTDKVSYNEQRAGGCTK